MHELTVTQCASPSMNSANSRSKAWPSGPCVRTWPSNTASTRERSSSVIHGRANGTSRVSLPILDFNGSPFGDRSVGGNARAHYIEFVLPVRDRLHSLQDGRDERGDERSFGRWKG